MKILVATLLLFFIGCSPQYHLRKALEKDPNIIDVKGDTIIIRDTVLVLDSIRIQDTIEIKINSDTVIYDTILRIKNKSFGPINVSSKDGIAHAEAMMTNGLFTLKAYATYDTLKYYDKLFKFYKKQIHEKEIIILEKKAIIKRKNGFIQNLRNAAGLMLITMLIILSISIIRFFKKRE